MPIPSRPQKQRTECHSDGNSPPHIVTFPVTEGIFGVGRLATRLKALEGTNQIGSWHVGHWIDHTHTAIRIQFDNDEDARVATLSLLV